MRKKLGFLHAHHSNISYIDDALGRFGIDAFHFVDPGLVHRIRFDAGFSEREAAQKVAEQVSWISTCDVAAVVVTCTNYAALLPGAPWPVPVITIDEPLFAHLCRQRAPQLLLFTNAATVEGTMKRLRAYAENHGASPQVEARLIDDLFELVMQGRTEEYNAAVASALRDAVSSGVGDVSVAQLSMVPAAAMVERELGRPIGNPLAALSQRLQAFLGPA